jgi:hypothetical protein
MIRDPFNIHRKNAFGAAALRTANNLKESVVQAAGAHAPDMAFSIPKHVPNFADPHRANEDRAWSGLNRRDAPKAGGLMGDMQDRVNGLFDQKSLPMYKDKPYNFVPSSRRRPLWRKKRALGFGTLTVMFVLYMLGFFSGRDPAKPSSSGWQWKSSHQDKGVADWNKRRESVVEAFQATWDAYEEHGWGTYKPSRC